MTFAEERQSGIGGSDVAALLGLSPWKTPLQLYMEKLGLSTVTETQAMRLGTKWEPIIASEYTEQTGIELVSGGFHRSKEHPFLACHLDYVGAKVKKLVECKYVGYRTQSAWGDEGTDQIPEYYIMQVMTYMGVCGFTEADVAAFFGSQNVVRIYTVRFNQRIFDAIVKAAGEFWERVQTKNPPEESDAGIMADYIRAIYPKSEPKTMEADQLAEGYLYQLGQAQVRLREAENGLEIVSNKIKEKMQDAECLISPTRGKIYWKSTNPKPKVDHKAIVAELNPPAELIEKHTEPGKSTRQFRAYLKGDESGE